MQICAVFLPSPWAVLNELCWGRLFCLEPGTSNSHKNLWSCKAYGDWLARRGSFRERAQEGPGAHFHRSRHLLHMPLWSLRLWGCLRQSLHWRNTQLFSRDEASSLRWEKDTGRQQQLWARGKIKLECKITERTASILAYKTHTHKVKMVKVKLEQVSCPALYKYKWEWSEE